MNPLQIEIINELQVINIRTVWKIKSVHSNFVVNGTKT